MLTEAVQFMKDVDCLIKKIAINTHKLCNRLVSIYTYLLQSSCFFLAIFQYTSSKSNLESARLNFFVFFANFPLKVIYF